MHYIHDPFYILKKDNFLKRDLSWESMWECLDDVFSIFNGGYYNERLREVRSNGILSYLFLTAFLMPYMTFSPSQDKVYFFRSLAIGIIAIPLFIVQSFVSLAITILFSPLITLGHVFAQLLPKNPKIKVKKEVIEKDLTEVAKIQLQDIRHQGAVDKNYVIIPSQERSVVTLQSLCGGSYQSMKERMQNLYFEEMSVSYTLSVNNTSSRKTYYSTKIFNKGFKGDETALILYENDPASPGQGLPLAIAEMKPENYRAIKPLLTNAEFYNNMQLSMSLNKSFLKTIVSYETTLSERQNYRKVTSVTLLGLFRLNKHYVNSKPDDLIHIVNQYVFAEDYTTEPKEYSSKETKPDDQEEINYPLIIPLL